MAASLSPRNHLPFPAPKALAVGASACLLAACLEPITPEPVTLWEGVLEPRAEASVYIQGSIAMVANPTTTQIGIGLVSVEPQGTAEAGSLHWWVRSGSCAGSGAPVANPEVFPPLEGSGGEGRSTEVVLQRRLDVTGVYSAEVRLHPEDGSEVLGCGELVRRN